MDEMVMPLISTGSIKSIKFGIATSEDIKRSSVCDEPVSKHNLVNNPWLGLPLERGHCESCSTNEPGQCEGHFGFIELAVPIYHPQHVSELRSILNLVCLKCLRMRKGKVRVDFHRGKISKDACSYCQVDLPIVNEIKIDGTSQLQLKYSTRSRLKSDCWSFLDKYGFHYGESYTRPLLPSEVLNILNAISEDTKKRLEVKGHFLHVGYVLQLLPVPPNCLCVQDISDGNTILSNDISIEMLKKILGEIQNIKGSRSGKPNFEAMEVESNKLQAVVAQYLHFRGTKKEPVTKKKFWTSGEVKNSSSTEWLQKMRSLFISKGSGFSSRSVISGDSYRGLHEIGIPSQIAKKMTVDERVTSWNLKYLQKLVDERLCLTYRHGSSLYSTEEGAKGHTALKVGQVVSRRVLEGDIVFVNRPPTTHKHALQAFTVYLHDDHTVKINPLVCAPFGADFDGDCVHVFFPQSLPARSEALELFTVDKQLCSSHNGALNLQLVSDAQLAFRLIPTMPFYGKATAQQLAMFTSPVLPLPSVRKAYNCGPFWTVFQILQGCLPCVDCSGPSHMIVNGEIIRFEFSRDSTQLLGDVAKSILVSKGPGELLAFFNKLQPLMMEILFLDGYSISLKDFDISESAVDEVRNRIQEISQLLHDQRIEYSNVVENEVENKLNELKSSLLLVILKSSFGGLIDVYSNSSNFKLIQQFGFLGQELSATGKLYSKSLVDDIFSHFMTKHSIVCGENSSEAYGLIKSSFFHGLNPFEELVHSIASREVIIRSSRGLSEPGTLFKDLMAILRDVVVSYDGTVRHMCSNSIVQFEYAADAASMCRTMNMYEPGEPVGALAATAIANPAYKAVLDSSQSTNSSWELMKEILRSTISFSKNDKSRSITLYMKDCDCGRKFCKERAAWMVHDFVRKVAVKDCVISFSISYDNQMILNDSGVTVAGLVGHILMNKMPVDILAKCQEAINHMQKKRGPLAQFLRRISLSVSDTCNYHEMSTGVCCLEFKCQTHDEPLETMIDVMANSVFPMLINVVIKGDSRVRSARITWINPNSILWVRSSKISKGEVAVEVVIEKDHIKKSGDAWRVLLECCLPVIHLIDTERSLPIGIQQIHSLLGVSCVFDESVQRLSAAIKAVSKNVLKEHLMLTASIMTCSGKLFGFNTSSNKALFHSLGVEVPFTQATQLMPMKCFGKAAERCVADSLASVVASNLWGKNVSIGTGTNFQLFWNTEKEYEEHVYEFLHMTKTNAGDEKYDSCLGVDVDDLVERCQTPEHDLAFEPPIFDDVDDTDGWANSAGPANATEALNQDKKWMKTPVAWEKPAVKWVNSAVNSGSWSPKSKNSGWEGAKSKDSDELISGKSNRDATISAQKHSAWANNTGWPSTVQSKTDRRADGPPVWQKAIDNHHIGKDNVSEQSTWGRLEGSAKESESEVWPPSAAEPNRWAKDADAPTAMQTWDNQKGARDYQDSANGNKGSPVWQKAIHNHHITKGSATEKSAWGELKASGQESESQVWPPSAAEPDRWTKDVVGPTAPQTWGNPKGALDREISATVNKCSSEKSAWEKPEPVTSSDGWGRWNQHNTKENQVCLPSSGEPTQWAKSIDVPTKIQNQDAQRTGRALGNQDTAFEKITWERSHESVPDSDGWGRPKEKRNTRENQEWPKESVPENKCSSEKSAWEKPEPVTRSNDWGRWNQHNTKENQVWLSSSNEPAQRAKSIDVPTEIRNQYAQRTGRALGNQDTASEKITWERSHESVPDSAGWSRPQEKRNTRENQEWPLSEAEPNQWSKSIDGPIKIQNQDDQRAEWQRNYDNQDTIVRSSWEKIHKVVPDSDGWGRTNEKCNAKENQEWPASSAEPDQWAKSIDRHTEIHSQDDQRAGWQRNFGNQDTVAKSAWEKTPESGTNGWGKRNENPHTWLKRTSKDNKFERTQSNKWHDNQQLFQSRYSTEEGKIVADIEPIMQSIRKILHQSSYNDGDRLSVDDQNFIVQKVLEYHPQKSNKVHDEVDFIKIDRHQDHPETRCFFVASTDGTVSDFSYKKCMENYVRQHYKDCESFCTKFFAKRGTGTTRGILGTPQTGIPPDATRPVGTPHTETSETPGDGMPASETTDQHVDTTTGSWC